MAIALTPEVRALLVLHLVPGLGPVRTAALLERFGTAEAVLRAGREELLEVNYVGPKLVADLLSTVGEADIDGELRLLEQHNTRLLVRGTPEYPQPLAAISDAPHLLYVRGTLEPRDGKAVGIVGSRHPTAYGKRMAEHLAAGLARAGYTVVSGLARGIDGVAHRAALQAGGRTVAVLAGGLSRIYPPEHAGLAKEVESAGALLTESTMAQEPLAPLFPARNRLISGLCQGVVIVEAAERSGALITASHAGEQGRSVMAVPGQADSRMSGGTNELIRKGAVLVRGPEDVREELEGVSAASAPPPGQEPPPEMDETQRRVWELLREQPRHLDEIVQRLGLGVPQVAGLLMMLELKKVVRRLPGNRYEAC